MCWCGRALRGLGAAEDGDLARPESPSRCTLPITALRVMPPSSAAIWLADSPSVQSLFNVSTRSSVQLMASNPSPVGAEKSGPTPTTAGPPTLCPRRQPPPRCTLVTCPPHDMTYLLIERLQYGESQAQESERPASTCSSTSRRCIHTYLRVRAAPGPRVPPPAGPDHVDRAPRRNKIPSRAARRGGTFHLNGLFRCR